MRKRNGALAISLLVLSLAWCSSSAAQEPPLPAGTAAITDLLVEPRWGRRGHGSRLLAAATMLLLPRSGRGPEQMETSQT